MKASIKQEFQPFDLTIKVESLDELKELYNRFNISNLEIKNALKGSYKEHFGVYIGTALSLIKTQLKKYIDFIP